jgi:hypothetical protein
MKNKKKLLLLPFLTAGLLFLTMYCISFFYDIKMPLAVSDYKISFNEGSITLVEYVGEDSELIIPERILGIPVRHIGPHCFSNAPKVISITIPDKMTIIDESAFSECKNLESIYARNIEIIGEYAFNDDTKLKNIELGDSIKIIGKGAFYRCETLKEISLNDGIESIGDYAFKYSGITDISGVEKADIIGELILNYTPWEENQKSDFVIIKDKLVAYKGKSEIVVVPDGVKVIDPAFDVEPGYDYPIQVSEVYIPDTVTEIKGFCFADQKSDIRVYIPDSVTTIGNCIFIGVDNAVIITTSGSTAEQYAIDNGINYEIVDSWEVPET